MWYIILIALVVLIGFAAWLFFAYLGFWLMVLLNLPIIVLIGLKVHGELYNKHHQEEYRKAAAIALVVTLAIYLFKIPLPFLLVTDFMVITFGIVKGKELFHSPSSTSLWNKLRR